MRNHSHMGNTFPSAVNKDSIHEGSVTLGMWTWFSQLHFLKTLQNVSLALVSPSDLFMGIPGKIREIAEAGEGTGIQSLQDRVCGLMAEEFTQSVRQKLQPWPNVAHDLRETQKNPSEDRKDGWFLGSYFICT